MIPVAIVGAGPYGLSIASHLRAQGIPFRIFGRLMDSWSAHMPKGMMLKSDGFASNISNPDGNFTLKQFCAERGIEYSDLGLPVRLDTFVQYGFAFKDRQVPELEERLVVSVERLRRGFALQLDNGETVKAERVILAVGITHFAYIPSELAHLPQEFLSHSFRHHDLEPFKGRQVVVLGGGASATDVASLLHEKNVDVTLVTREQLKFHARGGTNNRRSWWQRIRNPQSGLGPGLRSRFFADAPLVFHYLPQGFRLKTVRTFLGPAGGWFVKEKVIGRVPLMVGFTPTGAEVEDGKVRLLLRAKDGTERKMFADHVIAATGYKVDVKRLTFLNPEIRSQIKAVDGAPVLASTFESSVPGLYFVGIAAANSFGPVMRFAYGASFAARRIAQTLTRSIATDAQTAVPELDQLKRDATTAENPHEVSTVT